jgi:CRP-like cAMP-binding protein
MANFPISTFPSNSIIFNKGNFADKFFVVESGEVEIFDPDTNSKIAQLLEGDAFGEQAILVGGVRGASARAVTEVSCIEITTSKLRDMLTHEEGLLRPTVEALLLQLSLHNELKAKDSKGEVAYFAISSRFSNDDHDLNESNEQTKNSEFSKEELQQIHREIEIEKHKIQLKEGETVISAYEQLRKKKEDEIRAKQVKTEKPIAEKPRKISREELPDFLKSEEAKTLSTKDSLYLKLLNNPLLGSTVYTQGQKILVPGNSPNNAVIITSGEASESSPITGFSTLGPGSVIGLAEGLADQASRCEIIARTPIVAITIPINNAYKALKSSNSGLIGIARLTAMRILHLEKPPEALSK